LRGGEGEISETCDSLEQNGIIGQKWR